MPLIGLHCSHEQIPPSRLLAHVVEAEAAGFGAAMSSDHFSPWSERQGESGFAWSFLGAAMHATSLPWGIVNAPGQRYHPAIVAQAAATLCELFPERLWVALGTGEASNEHITGAPWPAKHVRAARLRECVDVIRALFAGEVVDHDGLVRVDRARLWTLPARPPALIGAAVTPETAALVRRVGRRPGHDQPAARDARAGARGVPRRRRRAASRSGCRCISPGRRPTPRRSRVAHDQWRTNVFAPPLCWDLHTVEQFDEAARHVRPEDVRESVLVASDLRRHVAWLQELSSLGFDQVVLHHVGRDLRPFIATFGEHVLPELAA